MRDEKIYLPALIDGARKALDEAQSFADVKAVMDKAEVLRQLARRSGAALEAMNRCAEIRIRAERRMGEELSLLDKNRGAATPLHAATALPTLEEIGIERTQSHRWQRLASIPERDFEHTITETKETGEELTTAMFLRMALKAPPRPEPEKVQKFRDPEFQPEPEDDERNRIKFGKPIISDEAREDIAEFLRKNRTLTNGGRVAAFEEVFTEMIGGGKAVAVSSCTAALHLALLACRVGPGDEVIVPAQTFVACAHIVEAVGAKPVFVDVWPDSGILNPDLIPDVLTAKTKAIMPVHYAGRPAYMGSLQSIARTHDLRIIEDCATALGARHSGKHVGLLGDVGCFSFHPVKHITTGEGGMLVSKDPAIAEAARRMREFGKMPKNAYEGMPGEYDVTGFGLNYRMTEISGALGVHQLADVERRLAVRKQNYALLKSGLNGHETLDLGGEEAAAYCLVVMLPDDVDRREVRADMARANVETSIYYPGPLPLLTYYRKKYGHKEGDFPNAERIANRSLALPVGPHLGPKHMAQIAQAFRSAIDNQRKITA